MLARHIVIARINDHPLLSLRIVRHCRAKLHAIRTTHDQGAHGVGPKINAKGELHGTHYTRNFHLVNIGLT